MAARDRLLTPCGIGGNIWAVIWLAKRIFGLGVVSALVFFGLQFQVGGRAVKDYLHDFFRSPIVQEAIRQGKGAVTSYLQKDLQPGDENTPPMDKISEDERRELEKVLKETH